MTPGETVVARAGRAVFLWEPASHRLRKVIELRARLDAVALSPDGKTLATGGCGKAGSKSAGGPNSDYYTTTDCAQGRIDFWNLRGKAARPSDPVRTRTRSLRSHTRPTEDRLTRGRVSSTGASAPGTRAATSRSQAARRFRRGLGPRGEPGRKAARIPDPAVGHHHDLGHRGAASASPTISRRARGRCGIAFDPASQHLSRSPTASWSGGCRYPRSPPRRARSPIGT